MFKICALLSPALLCSANFLGSSDLNLAAAEPVKVTLSKGNFDYACSYVRPYVHAGYLKNSSELRKKVCSQLQEGEIYRLEAGGIITKKGENCSVEEISTVNPTKILCGISTIKHAEVITAKTCPEGLTLVASRDIYTQGTDGKSACSYVNNEEYANIDDGRSIYVYRDEFSRRLICTTSSHKESVNKIGCVNPDLESFVIKNGDSESSCPKGLSLLTLKEASANQAAYCDLIKNGEGARLAGGTFLYKDEKRECGILSGGNTDKVIFGLCAPENRKL